jgi:hypothetical protein
VAAVIWTIQVLPIPAGREDYSSPDASGAYLEGEVERVLVIARSESVAVSVAAVTNAGQGTLRRTGGWVSSDHPETLYEVRLTE